MASQNKVEIEIILKGAAAAKDLKSFSADAAHGLKDVGTQAKGAAKGLADAGDATGGLSKALDGLKVIAIATAAAYAGLRIIKEITAFLKDAGEEAAGQELALKSLHTTLVANKRAYGDFEQQVIAQAEAMQQLTGFTDDAVESTAKILAPYENITNDLFPRTLQATADLARALGIDLPSAAQMVGMASLGMTRGLKQIGIDVDEATFKSIGFAGVLEQLESKVKGQADAYRTTSKGLSEYIKTMWSEVKEQFGVIVNQVLDPFKKAAGEVLTVLADKLAEWTKGVDLKTWASTAAENIKNLALVISDDLIPKLIQFTDWLQKAATVVPATFEDIKARAAALIDILKVGIDAWVLFWMVATGQGPKAVATGEFKKAYDDLGKAIEDIKKINAVVAEDVEKEPIEPQVDNAEAKNNIKELYDWWANYKAEMEKEPIHIRIVRETIGPEGETQTEYAKERLGGLIRKQAGGFLPGFGGGDRIPAMLEAGEFIMRKEAVRSLGVDMLNALNRGANAGGQQGYFVLDLRGGGKSYPLQVKKDDTADALLEALRRKELVQG